MKEPTLVTDQSNFNYAVTGPLSHGGTVTNVPESLTITFACTPNKTSKSDIEINLQFNNDEIIPLYFSKECDFATADEEYFNFIYTIYWILLFLILFFIISIIYYYIKTNNLTVTETVAIVLDKVYEVYYKIKVRINCFHKNLFVRFLEGIILFNLIKGLFLENKTKQK